MPKSVEKVAMESAGVLVDRVDQLRELIPEGFTEGKVDFDKLRRLRGFARASNSRIEARPRNRHTRKFGGCQNTPNFQHGPVSARLRRA